MKTTKWKDLQHKGTAEMRAKVKAEALEELEHVRSATTLTDARPCPQDYSEQKASTLS